MHGTERLVQSVVMGAQCALSYAILVNKAMSACYPSVIGQRDLEFRMAILPMQNLTLRGTTRYLLL